MRPAFKNQRGYTHRRLAVRERLLEQTVVRRQGNCHQHIKEVRVLARRAVVYDSGSYSPNDPVLVIAHSSARAIAEIRNALK